MKANTRYVSSKVQKPKVQPTVDLTNLEVVSFISKSNFSVYLAQDSATKKRFAMKVFHYENNSINPCYLKEIQFAKLSHPNIMSILKTVDERSTIQENQIQLSSYYVMDLCVCDFTKLVQDFNIFEDEKLVRTYFLQLVEGLSYLHNLDIGHLDIKLENVLLSEQMTLKIADFDRAVSKKSYTRDLGLGTSNSRAPELITSTCRDMKKADVFSAATCLFIMAFGYFPYLETQEVQGYNLFKILLEQPEKFWKVHAKLNHNVEGMSGDLKDLFLQMTKYDPSERLDFSQVRKHKWCQGGVYDKKELEVVMKKRLGMN